MSKNEQLVGAASMTDAQADGMPMLTLPAALIRVWSETGSGRGLSEARQRLGERDGVAWPRPDLCAVWPTSGDPAVFDTALAVARDLERGARNATGDAGLRLLIFPGSVRTDGRQVEVLPSPLLEDLEAQAAPVQPGTLCLTSYAARRLEIPRHSEDAGKYEAPSGWRVPIYRVGLEDPSVEPWRNAKLLRRRLSYVPRPDLDRRLAEASSVAWRVSGPLGTGKTRSVWQDLVKRQETSPVWVHCRPARHRGPSVAAQILYQLLERTPQDEVLSRFEGLDERLGLRPKDLLDPTRSPDQIHDLDQMLELLPRWLGVGTPDDSPITVVCDGLGSATENDLAMVPRLVEAALDERRFRVVVLARSGTLWSNGLGKLPLIEVPPMSDAELQAFSQVACSGLSLPEEVEGRFLQKSTGHPFALEEGLTALIHRKMIRQVYGNFFYSGSADTDFTPSQRLVQHVFADALRIGRLQDLQLLAIAGIPLPESVPGSDPDSNEPAVARAEGWLEATASPWGRALRLRCAANGQALAGTLDDSDRRRGQQNLGLELLRLAPAGAWWTFRLLEGSSAALGPLLMAAQNRNREPGPFHPTSKELLRALKRELLNHRERDGDDAEELELLSHLLPLARKLGELEDHAVFLPHALEIADGSPRKILAFAALKAELEEQRGNLAEAEETLQEALQKTGSRDQPGGVLVLIHLGRLLIRQQRYGEARELLEGVEGLLSKKDPTPLSASCSFYLGNIALHQNRLSDAWDLHGKALEVRRSLGLQKPVGTSLSALGSVSLLLGRYAEALAYYREAEEIFQQGGEQKEVSFALLGIGRALSRLGDFAAASPPIRRALELRETDSDPAGRAIARLAVAENHLHLERLGNALKEARQGHFDLSLLPSSMPALGDAEQLLGRILLAQRNYRDAIPHLATALDSHRRHGNPEAAAFDLAWWLEAVLGQERTEEVHRLAADLDSKLREDQHFEQREILEFRLYQAFAWLGESAAHSQLAMDYLKRAYEALLRKVSNLSPEQRHRFLFQIPEHQEILSAATEKGLSWPDL